MHNRRILAAALLLAASPFMALPAAAQDKPPLKILVGFPPGGSADVIARLIGDAIRDDFSTRLGGKPPRRRAAALRSRR
jgi:tripartite-type tricarboxylate transporter receptor subunit TctC